MRPQVNLLPKYTRYSNLSYILFIIGLILFLILASVLTYIFFKERNTILDHETQIASLSEQKQILETRLSAAVDTDTTSLVHGVTFAENHAVPVSGLVNEFMELLPDNSYLREYVYDYNTVTVETQFETMADTAGYMELLTESKYLMNPQVDFIETEETEEAVNAESEDEPAIQYDVVPRYQATYSADVDQQVLIEEEEDE